jgi:hypothetical protein
MLTGYVSCRWHIWKIRARGFQVTIEQHSISLDSHKDLAIGILMFSVVGRRGDYTLMQCR